MENGDNYLMLYLDDEGDGLDHFVILKMASQKHRAVVGVQLEIVVSRSD